MAAGSIIHPSVVCDPFVCMWCFRATTGVYAMQLWRAGVILLRAWLLLQAARASIITHSDTSDDCPLHLQLAMPPGTGLESHFALGTMVGVPPCCCCCYELTPASRLTRTRSPTP